MRCAWRHMAQPRSFGRRCADAPAESSQPWRPSQARGNRPMTDWVVYGTAAWDAPWLTEHNLASCLSETGRVLFVEPATTPLAPLRHGVTKSTAAGLRRLARVGLHRHGQVHVLTP